jgi:hypothetical protein
MISIMISISKIAGPSWEFISECPVTYQTEIIEIQLRTKMPWECDRSDTNSVGSHYLARG